MGGRDTTHAMYRWFQADRRGPETGYVRWATRSLDFSLDKKAAFRRRSTVRPRRPRIWSAPSDGDVDDFIAEHTASTRTTNWTTK